MKRSLIIAACLAVFGLPLSTVAQTDWPQKPVTMVVPYPPGIPVIMQGERCGPATRAVVDYLVSLEGVDSLFPGFESEVHGADVVAGDGRRVYYIYCVTP